MTTYIVMGEGDGDTHLVGPFRSYQRAEKVAERLTEDCEEQGADYHYYVDALDDPAKALRDSKEGY